MNNQLIKSDNAITIKQHNAITEARYEMSALQKNIFYLLLAQLKNENENSSQSKYKLSIKDVNSSRNIRVRRAELRQAARGLITSGLTLYDDNQKRFITIGILASADYGEGDDRENLIVEFDSKLYPFLYNVKSRFTTFTLLNALNLKSKYSKRIYEMLCQFKDTGIFRISVKELKERFGLINLQTGKETYSDFRDFARKVLEVAKQELAEQTDINFTYTTKKTGRKITDLEFHIKYIPSAEDSSFSNLPAKYQKEKTTKDSPSKKYPSDALSKEELAPYLLLTNELRWLNSKMAYLVVKNVPIQKLFDHIHRVKIAIQTGKIVGKVTVEEYFKRLLNSSPEQKIINPEKKLEDVEQSNLLESKRNSVFSIWRKMVFEFEINYKVADRIINQIPYENLQPVLDSISEELQKDYGSNKKAYVLSRLKSEFNLDVT